MTPVYQTRFGKDGNCWAACLASLFDVPLESVDHCACNHENWRQETTKWLFERGLFSIEIQPYKSENGWVYPFVWPANPTICIVAGPRENSTTGLNHVVVARTFIDTDDRGNFEMIHDPLGPLSTRLAHLTDIIFFGKIFSAEN